jgi:DNA polymerase III alpha subunit
MLKAGCFDSFGATRASLAGVLPAAIQLGEQRTRAHAAGQDDLFGGLASPATGDERATIEIPVLPEWSEAQRLQGERETLGLFLSGHPIAEFEQELRQVAPARIVDLGGPRPQAEQRFGGGKNVTVAGLVLEMRRRGSRMTLVLDDRSARIEVSLFDDVWQQHRAVIARDAILVVEGQLRYDEFIDDWRINAKKLTPIEILREREAASSRSGSRPAAATRACWRSWRKSFAPAAAAVVRSRFITSAARRAGRSHSATSGPSSRAGRSSTISPAWSVATPSVLATGRGRTDRSILSVCRCNSWISSSRSPSSRQKSRS